jgi:hypothetical protein
LSSARRHWLALPDLPHTHSPAPSRPRPPPPADAAQRPLLSLARFSPSPAPLPCPLLFPARQATPAPRAPAGTCSHPALPGTRTRPAVRGLGGGAEPGQAAAPGSSPRVYVLALSETAAAPGAARQAPPTSARAPRRATPTRRAPTPRPATPAPASPATAATGRPAPVRAGGWGQWLAQDPKRLWGGAAQPCRVTCAASGEAQAQRQQCSCPSSPPPLPALHSSPPTATPRHRRVQRQPLPRQRHVHRPARQLPVHLQHRLHRQRDLLPRCVGFA